MELTVRKKELADALAKAKPAVSKRSSLPVLSGIKLSARDSAFTVEATDLESAITVEGTASSSSAGAAVVPASSLTSALKALDGDEVTIDLREEDRPRVEISSGSRRIVIDGYAVADWPQMASAIEWTTLCHFESSELSDALSRIVLCASDDEARPVLTGIQFNFGKERLELAATDSYRLGVLSLAVAAHEGTGVTEAIIPARILKTVAKQLKKHKGAGSISAGVAGQNSGGTRLIQFSFGEVRWITRQIEGEFPNWPRLIPEEFAATLEFDPTELTSAAKNAATLRSSKSVPVRLSLGDTCHLRMSDPGVADIDEELVGASYSADGVGPLEVAFNPDFLIDGIRFVGGDRAQMRASDGSKAAMFLGEGDRRYLLMPVRLAR